MKYLTKRLLTLGLITSTVFTSISAFAGPNDQPRGPEDYSDRQHGQPRHNQGPQPQFQQRDHGPNRPHSQGPYYAQQGPRGDNQQWRKGQYVPKQYRSSHYYVNDWRHQQLPSPPRGHRWLNVNGDYILVAVATGVISSILLHQH
ncbi:RcnB family protein [Acinetobacter boissieri]|uniref:Regulator RcnB of Ni and Co efflux n=1 Tax=Acinetobacter boissieri TaxID=1219383 RepID=A0A1G6IY57_9GAMM|nr:RcnB family protein [Acinetobacter boissieri]SDC11323.1 regulator RcnB of Ni and Co efflux [Acinetobacter boissieri]